MNYRHAFHAGNFADVLKHVVFAFALQRLGKKDKPFSVIDTHAGIGWYDLDADEARRSPEWRNGVDKLWSGEPPAGAAELLAPYLSVLRAMNADGTLRRYPGSPAIAAELARAQDRLTFCELHPEDAEMLTARYQPDARARIEKADGYARLKALTPPPERRGVVMVDPPFEHVDEMYFLARAAREAIERWPTGTFIFWRPLKDLWAAERFDVALAEWLLMEKEFAPEKLLRADYWVRELGGAGPLAGAGVVVVNPPYGLEEGLLAFLPWACALFAQGEGAGWRLDGAFTDDSLTVDEF